MKLKALLAAALAALAMTSCSKSDNSTAAGNNATAVLDNIMTRTSVRQFTSEPIAADTLETIVKAGMAAPTAMNKQPWEFIVVTERAALDSLMAVHPYSNLQTATAAIIVCGNMQKAIEGTGRDFWVQDCSAATENILLAAHACGLVRRVVRRVARTRARKRRQPCARPPRLDHPPERHRHGPPRRPLAAQRQIQPREHPLQPLVIQKNCRIFAA